MKKKLSLIVCLALCLSGLSFSQNSSTAPATQSDVAAQIQQMKAMLQQQQHRIETLEQRLATQQAAQPDVHAPSLGQVASTSPLLPHSSIDAALPMSTAKPPASPQGEAAETSPLQFHIGSAYITPVGFMDFTSVWRSKDGGSSIGTNFAGIPYGNTFQTRLAESRFSMQNSRLGLRVDAMVKGAHVIGYMESDFLGFSPGNAAVSSNSNSLRSRLYWVDLRKSKWEVLGGQTWSLITPGRSGISPLPGDVFFTQNMDVNYQAGLVWGRIPEFRVVFHPSEKAALAFALDSPEQYIGGSAGGSLITAPAALTATYVGGELNNGGSTFGTPNRAPDIIVKLALDPSKRFHFEVGGVARQFQLFNPVTATHYSATGGGGFANLNFELAKGFRILSNNFWSDGGGRYIFGQAPDLIARINGSPSLVHSGSTVDGFEFTHKSTLLFGYYGGIYVGRDFVIDTNGKPVGYGYTGSPSGQNRSVQEGTFGINQTIWKDAKYGALNFIGQYSYLTRNPWSIAAGSPSNADLHMFFLDLRYTLPGSAPTMGK